MKNPSKKAICFFCLVSIPNVKAKALEVLSMKFKTQKEGKSEIRSVVKEYYEREQKEYWDTNQEKVNQAIEQLVDIF